MTKVKKIYCEHGCYIFLDGDLCVYREAAKPIFISTAASFNSNNQWAKEKKGYSASINSHT